MTEGSTGPVPSSPAIASDSNPPRSPLASRSARLGAVALDLLIMVMAPVLVGSLAIHATDSETAHAVVVILMLAGWLALTVIQVVLLVKHGQTIGKRALRIRVVTMSDETVPGFAKIILLRTLLPAFLVTIPVAGLAVWLADVFWIFRDDRRCLHDLIAETKVIRVQTSQDAAC